MDGNGNNVLSVQSEGRRPLIATKLYAILLRNFSAQHVSAGVK